MYGLIGAGAGLYARFLVAPYTEWLLSNRTSRVMGFRVAAVVRPPELSGLPYYQSTFAGITEGTNFPFNWGPFVEPDV